jgi:hypothetical protein
MKEKSIIAPEILEKIKKSETAYLKNELMCRKENLFEEPCCAEDPEYVAITQAIEEELRSRGAL